MYLEQGKTVLECCDLFALETIPTLVESCKDESKGRYLLLFVALVMLDLLRFWHLAVYMDNTLNLRRHSFECTC